MIPSLSHAQKLGSINLDGSIVITDPCYISNLNGNGIVYLDITPGQWDFKAYISEWGLRVGALVGNLSGVDLFNVQWKEMPDYLDVDSGQMSISSKADISNFDSCPRPCPETYWQESKGTFSYGGACDITLEGTAGILCEKMVVSQTGYGDGTYPLEVVENDEGIVALRVLFIEEEDDND